MERASLDYTILVATSDDEVIKYCRGKDYIVRDTKKYEEKISNGTERCYYALEGIELDDDDVVVNVQGDQFWDEGFDYVLSMSLRIFLGYNEFYKDNIDCVVTAGKDIAIADFENPDVVKVIRKNSGRSYVYDFKRVLSEQDMDDFYNSRRSFLHHVGVYCISYGNLTKYISFEKTKNEIDRDLEQFRFWDNGIKIKCIKVNRGRHFAINTREEHKRALKDM
jgi:CMP-2-keto-3-deoxyoctulosonic acid synthetase